MPVTENTPRATGAEIGLDDVDARQGRRQFLAAQATEYLETETGGIGAPVFPTSRSTHPLTALLVLRCVTPC